MLILMRQKNKSQLNNYKILLLLNFKTKYLYVGIPIQTFYVDKNMVYFLIVFKTFFH